MWEGTGCYFIFFMTSVVHVLNTAVVELQDVASNTTQHPGFPEVTMPDTNSTTIAQTLPPTVRNSAASRLLNETSESEFLNVTAVKDTTRPVQVNLISETCLQGPPPLKNLPDLTEPTNTDAVDTRKDPETRSLPGNRRDRRQFGGFGGMGGGLGGMGFGGLGGMGMGGMGGFGSGMGGGFGGGLGGGGIYDSMSMTDSIGGGGFGGMGGFGGGFGGMGGGGFGGMGGGGIMDSVSVTDTFGGGGFGGGFGGMGGGGAIVDSTSVTDTFGGGGFGGGFGDY